MLKRDFDLAVSEFLFFPADFHSPKLNSGLYLGQQNVTLLTIDLINLFFYWTMSVFLLSCLDILVKIDLLYESDHK